MATKTWISTSSTSFTTAANWSDNAAPANGDTLIFNGQGTANVATNLSTTLTGLTLIVEKSYGGQIGVLSGSTATYLVIDGGTLHVGQQSGQGSPTGSSLVMVNFGSTAGTAYVYDSASTGASTYYPPVILKGTALTLFQTGGSVGVAPLTGETATLTAATISKGPGSVAPTLYLGSGVTQTLVTAKNGTVFSRSAQTAATTTISGDATYRTEGSGAHTTINCHGNGKVLYGCTGTITTLNLSGEFNTEQYPQGFTITDRNFSKGARFFGDNGRSASMTFTNAYTLDNCAIQDVHLRLPTGKNL